MGNVGTFGDISFYVKSKKGKGKMIGLSDIVLNSTAEYEEHQRNGKKSILEFISPGLSELTFNVYANAQYGAKPLTIQTKLTKYMKNGTPKNFILGGKKIGTNKWVITSVASTYTVVFRDGRPVAIQFAVSLKEYANSAVTNKKTTSKSTSTNKTASDKSVKKTNYEKYTVKDGDTLWGLAVKYYGNGLKYTTIYNANKTAEAGFNKISDPDKIRTGWIIKIPK